MMRRRAGCVIRSHKQAGDVWKRGELYHLQSSWRVHGLHLHISEGALRMLTRLLCVLVASRIKNMHLFSCFLFCKLGIMGVNERSFWWTCQDRTIDMDLQREAQCSLLPHSTAHWY